MPRSKSIFAILMILSFFFNGAQAMLWRKKIVIGYTVVTSREAMDINKNNKLYIKQSLSTNELGDGIYMRNNPEGLSGRERDWFCAIKAKKWKIKQADKVFIPEFYEPKTSDDGARPIQLWRNGEEVIKEYIKLQQRALPKLKKALRFPPGRGDEPEKALRFSWVKKEGDLQLSWADEEEQQLQMAIPMKVVHDDERLDLWAKCFESKDELKKFSPEAIEWETWDIIGNPGQP